MNAAKAKKNPAKVKGAVLIMILAVMTVLIILLAGSIAVVYSAHNRAFVKYTESQGYYTARSVLDNFYAELSNYNSEVDSAGNDMGKYYSLSGEKYDTLETFENLGIARSIELDAYKAQVNVREGTGYKEWFIKYCDENKSNLSDLINKFEGSSTDYTSASDGHNTALYAKVEQYMVNLNKNAISDYSTYNLYYDQFLPVTSVASDMQGDTIIYEIASLDGFGSGTIDTDGDGTPDTSIQIGNMADSGVQKAWVTVQVQERILQMGTGDTYGECFRAAEPHKADHFVAKVTSHVIFNGEEVTTSLIWKNVGKTSNNPPGDAGVSSLGPIDTTTSFTAIGNATSLSTKYHELTNNSLYSGNIYIQGSFDTGTATPILIMNESNAFYVGDILKVNTNPPDTSGMCDGALFYANIAQLWSSGASFGNAATRVNLITKQFEAHSTTKEFYGRIFADKFDLTTPGSELTQTYVKTAVATGNAAFPNSERKIHGDVYCNFLGVPADRVYLELNDAAGTAIFHLNYDPVSHAALPESDPKRIENMIDASNTINVFQGISIINSVIEEPRTKNDSMGSTTNVYVNGHEKYQYPDASGIVRTYDYFRDAGAAGANAPGTKFKQLDTDCTIQMNQINTGTIEYQVQIDWSNVNPAYVKHHTNLKIDLMNSINYEADKASGVWTLDGEYKKNFTLPNVNGTQLKLVGTEQSTYKLPTHRSLFGKYFYNEITNGVTSTDFPKTFDDDTAAFSMAPGDTSHEPLYSFDDFIDEHAVQAEAFKAGIDTTGAAVDITTIPDFTLLTSPVTIASGGGDEVNGFEMPSWSRVISSDGYIPANGGDGNTYYIDARSNEIELQLGDGSSNQTFTGTYIVYGDKQVTITVPGCTSGPDNQTIHLGTSGCPFIFMTEEIYSGAFKDTIVIQDPVAGKPIGPNAGTVVSQPNIDWYFSSKKIAEADLHTGGSGVTCISGYVTAPSVFFKIDTNINGLPRDTYYCGDHITGDNAKYTFFGSVFCKKYTGGQHAGVCLIPQKASVSGVPGDQRAYSPSAEYSWTN